MVFAAGRAQVKQSLQPDQLQLVQGDQCSQVGQLHLGHLHLVRMVTLGEEIVICASVIMERNSVLKSKIFLYIHKTNKIRGYSC